MSNLQNVDIATLSEKVAAILSQSSLQPGLTEMAELMKIAAEIRSVDGFAVDMQLPAVTTVAAHSFS